MTITFIPYTPVDFVKPPQFVEETSFGVPPAAPSFQIIGSLQAMSPSIGIQKEVVRSIGERDPVTQAKMMEVFSGSIRYRPFDTDFMKYGVNLPNGAGTNEESVTIAFSIKVNGTEKFFAFSGVKTDRISIEIAKDAGVTISQDLRWATSTMYATDLTAIGITTPTWITTTPSTQPWSSLTGGADPFEIESTGWPVDRFKCDVAQNLAAISPNGSDSLEYLAPTIRETTFDFDTWDYSSALSDYLMNLTLVDAEYTVYYDTVTPANSETLSFTNAGFDSRTWDFDAASRDFQRQSITATAGTVTLS